MSLDDYNKKPRVQKENDSKTTGDGIICGLSAMQGMRSEMEDSHLMVIDYPFPGWSFYAVFDGHGGDFSSKTCSKLLHRQIFICLFKKFGIDPIANNLDIVNYEHVKNKCLNEETIISAIKEGFLQMDRLLREIRDQSDKSGTTVIAALINPLNIYLINCGDSRGLLVKRNLIEISTFDHKPSELKERQRIQNVCFKKLSIPQMFT